mmetsp:Transcript_35430/g.79291  ORF Transcript_35430/g.79291 Transcript_35430/m.79291 type:complete len:218 (+) Transcript_35430:299-952(+)
MLQPGRRPCPWRWRMSPKPVACGWLRRRTAALHGRGARSLALRRLLGGGVGRPAGTSSTLIADKFWPKMASGLGATAEIATSVLQPGRRPCPWRWRMSPGPVAGGWLRRRTAAFHGRGTRSLALRPLLGGAVGRPAGVVTIVPRSRLRPCPSRRDFKLAGGGGKLTAAFQGGAGSGVWRFFTAAAAVLSGAGGVIIMRRCRWHPCPGRRWSAAGAVA